MKSGYIGILIISIVLAAALAVSGCSGGSSTATPTPQPGGYTTGTPTPAPTPGATGLTNVAQLYSAGNLHAYSFRLTSSVNGQTTTNNYAVSYADATYSGVAAKHTTMNYDMPATGSTPASQLIVDLYTSKADGSTLGGHMKMVTNGQTVVDMDIPASQASTYAQNDVATSSQTGTATLTNAGTETVTIDGKSYSCTKYTYTAGANAYTVWYTPQAPMPVKSTWTDDKGNSYTMELLSWS